MANRQNSGSDSAHPNQRPNAQNEESIPEMNEDVVNMTDEGDDDEFEDTEHLDDEEDEGDEEIR